MKILIMNGPNLNLLGQREPEVYGTLTLEEINREIARHAQTLNEVTQGEQLQPQPEQPQSSQGEQIELHFYQSNHEGQLIDTIQAAQGTYEGIIYNPAAHTHYSIAIRDAIASIKVPVVEVHLSDINSREGFRAVSVIKDVCIGQCTGKHVDSYKEALDLIVAHLKKAKTTNFPEVDD